MIDVLCTLGHVASHHSLTSRGITPGQLRRAVATGRIQRLRRGVYGCAHLDEQIARAAAIGGALTCVSVLRSRGVWASDSLRLHLQLPPTSSATQDPSVQFHWARPRFGLRSPWEATPLQSLWQALHCLDEENAIAAMESAIRSGFLRPEQIRQLAVHAPRRLQDGIRRMVDNSGSGNETIVRLRLERGGFSVVAQGHVPGMGHHDLVVDDCVGIDVDGRAWHEGNDRFATDRDRDVQAEGWGAIRCAFAAHTSSGPGRTLSRQSSGPWRMLGGTVSDVAGECSSGSAIRSRRAPVTQRNSMRCDATRRDATTRPQDRRKCDSPRTLCNQLGAAPNLLRERRAW